MATFIIAQPGATPQGQNPPLMQMRKMPPQMQRENPPQMQQMVTIVYLFSTEKKYFVSPIFSSFYLYF